MGGFTTSDDSEAAYLESQSDDGAEESVRQHDTDKWEKKAKALYALAVKSAVGSTIQCPACKKRFIKKTYNKTFCSNQRTVKKGTLSCKDAYWNHLRDWRSDQHRYDEGLFEN